MPKQIAATTPVLQNHSTGSTSYDKGRIIQIILHPVTKKITAEYALFDSAGEAEADRGSKTYDAGTLPAQTKADLVAFLTWLLNDMAGSELPAGTVENI